MSTDEDPRAVESIEPTDASATPGTDDAASADTLAELRDIESAPLSERAPRYQELADSLRTELEHSDPSRGPS